MPKSSDASSEELLAGVVATLEENKAEELVQIDLRGRTAMGDYMVIASGRSSRQVGAMAEKLVRRSRQISAVLPALRAKMRVIGCSSILAM